MVFYKTKNTLKQQSGCFQGVLVWLAHLLGTYYSSSMVSRQRQKG
jgi:hypothetical protein